MATLRRFFLQFLKGENWHIDIFKYYIEWYIRMNIIPETLLFETPRLVKKSKLKLSTQHTSIATFSNSKQCQCIKSFDRINFTYLR